MPYIPIHPETANAAQMFYADNGADNEVRNRRPALILVHGAGGTHLHWPASLRTLPDRRVVAPDLPGHGRSAGPGCATIDAYAEVVMGIVRAVGITRAVLVGHSMGGAVAQTVALRQPAWLAGLVLVATGARLRVADAILSGLATDFARTVDWITTLSWGPTASPVRVALAAYATRQTDPAVMRGDFVACNQFDVSTALAQIAVPTLVIGATHDKMTPSKYSRYLAAHIPGAACLIVPHAGHMVALEHPLRVTAAIQQFVKRL